MPSANGTPSVQSVPMPTPRPDEVLLESRAIALNLIDAMNGFARRIVLPWLTYPAVLGSDVAGTVVAIGSDVSDLCIGDRAVAYATGVEKNRNDPEQGAFRTHVRVQRHMTARIPDHLSFADAAVLPLALTTAAAGLFETGQLALALPDLDAPRRGESVVIFGGATSVGMNAIQLATLAGYTVTATASARNFHLLRNLGAAHVVDYHDRNLVEQLVSSLDGQPLAGALAIAAGSLPASIAVTRSSAISGSGRVASAHPTPITKVRAALATRHNVRLSSIWGASPKDNFVGPAIWNDFLPDALERGRFAAAPSARIEGRSLSSIPDGLSLVRSGVRAEKIVVLIPENS